MSWGLVGVSACELNIKVMELMPCCVDRNTSVDHGSGGRELVRAAGSETFSLRIRDIHEGLLHPLGKR